MRIVADGDARRVAVSIELDHPAVRGRYSPDTAECHRQRSHADRPWERPLDRAVDRVDHRDGAVGGVRDPDFLLAVGDRSRPVPDVDRLGDRVRRRIDARDRAVGGVRDPHRAGADGHAGGRTADLNRLAQLLGRLVDAGNRVVVGVGHPDRAVARSDAVRCRADTDGRRDVAALRVDHADLVGLHCVGRTRSTAAGEENPQRRGDHDRHDGCAGEEPPPRVRRRLQPDCGQAGRVHLEQALGLVDVLEAHGTEVAQRDVGQRIVAEK